MRVSIVGGSGYVGGELIRLILNHPHIELYQVSSEKYKNKLIRHAHPVFKNLNMKFVGLEDIKLCDTLFLCLPHGQSSQRISFFREKAENIIDLSADYRLSEKYQSQWYDNINSNFDDVVYGIPELFRDQMFTANFVSSAGCNATASILALYPLVKEGMIDLSNIFIDVKVGTSEAGKQYSFSSHHPERVRSIRSYKPTGHRHTAEILQMIENITDINANVYMSATSVDMVRGVLATIQVFANQPVTEKDLWKIYRKYYSDEPFIRIIKERTGNFRYPDPKILLASNYCDIGFEIDGSRIVLLSALDNLMKGAAGQAIQAFNIMHEFEETTGLTFPGLHLY